MGVELFRSIHESDNPIGKTIICLDDLNVREILTKIKTKNYLSYGFNINSNYQIFNEKFNPEFSTFDLKIKNYGFKKNSY